MVDVKVKRPPRSKTMSQQQVARTVEQQAKQRLRNSPYSFYLKDIDCYYEQGTLTLEGKVPTFYLKQIVQSQVRDVEGVNQVENRVDVVSARGLSSVRHK